MKKLTKENQKVIRKLADQLPKDSYEYLDKYKVLGKDIKKAGFSKEQIKQLGEIEPNKVYNYKGPAKNDVNHYRRMKKAFINGGSTELYKYIVKYIEDDDIKMKVLRFVHLMK